MNHVGVFVDVLDLSAVIHLSALLKELQNSLFIKDGNIKLRTKM